jgi:hypothetical protein
MRAEMILFGLALVVGWKIGLASHVAYVTHRAELDTGGQRA